MYNKACLTYSEKLVSYLARYTRKGVMSESRLASYDLLVYQRRRQQFLQQGERVSG
nr:transposase [Pseudoalteromonas aliena]